MADEIYRPLIERMTWSYSRLKMFEECRYKFFLNYICKSQKEHKFYADYGRLVHKIIEMFYKGEIPKDKLVDEFRYSWSDYIKPETEPGVKQVIDYFSKGVKYFSNFEEFPYKTISIEETFNFSIDGENFTGRIDYLGEDESGNLVLIDNKSRDLKPPSGRKKPTQYDLDREEMFTQLYLYSYPIKEKYGKLPSKLCFNCFKNGNFIAEKFNEEQYDKAIKWALSTIEEAENLTSDDIYPNIDYFRCNRLCSVCSSCCYYLEGGESNV